MVPLCINHEYKGLKKSEKCCNGDFHNVEKRLFYISNFLYTLVFFDVKTTKIRPKLRYAALSRTKRSVLRSPHSHFRFCALHLRIEARGL